MNIQSILIDQREPDHIKNMAFGGVPTIVGLVEYGDLHVACDDALLVIERKTPNDFLNTLREDRLMAQLTGCANLSRWAYLIIDGQLMRGRDGKTIADGRDTGWAWASVQGALLTAQEIGINVINSGGEYESTVLWLANHKRAPIVKTYRRRTAIFATPQEQVLAALPGIGEQRATTILSNHGDDLAWALCSLLDPDWTQPEVGDKTKSTLRKLFNLSDGEILWPYYNEQPKERTTTK